MTEPGWYNDDDPTRARWHDGTGWTEHTMAKADWQGSGAPPPPTAPSQPAFSQPSPPRQGTPVARSARADVKAEKARAKAMRPWWKKKRFIIPAVVVVVGGIAAAAGGGDDDRTTGGSGDVAREDADEVLTVGQTGTTSGFEVTLVTVEDPPVPDDPDFASEPDPGNKFIAVELSIRNTTDEPQTMSTILGLELVDSLGQRHDFTILIGYDRPRLDAEVQPGGLLRGWEFFEVPADATGLQLRVRGSLTADGVVFGI